MKRLVIRVCGSKHPPYRVKIGPGTKTRDVLAHLSLNEDYVLFPVFDPQKHFSAEEDLYDQIANDQNLIATLSPQAVEKYAQLFMQ